MTVETEFGKIVVDGKSYNKDILIDSNGKVFWRGGTAKQFYGTDHTICTEEVQYLLDTEPTPRVLIIGTGQYGGASRLEAGIKRECDKKNISLVTKKTPDAVAEFNKTAATKAALFHITC